MSPQAWRSYAVGFFAISLPFYVGAAAVARGTLKLWGW